MPQKKEVTVMPMPENFLPLLSLGLGLLVAVIYLIRFFRNKLAPVITVNAVVVHKQKVETISKYSMFLWRTVDKISKVKGS